MLYFSWIRNSKQIFFWCISVESGTLNKSHFVVFQLNQELQTNITNEKGTLKITFFICSRWIIKYTSLKTSCQNISKSVLKCILRWIRNSKKISFFYISADQETQKLRKELWWFIDTYTSSIACLNILDATDGFGVGVVVVAVGRSLLQLALPTT